LIVLEIAIHPAARDVARSRQNPNVERRYGLKSVTYRGMELQIISSFARVMSAK